MLFIDAGMVTAEGALVVAAMVAVFRSPHVRILSRWASAFVRVMLAAWVILLLVRVEVILLLVTWVILLLVAWVILLLFVACVLSTRIVVALMLGCKCMSLVLLVRRVHLVEIGSWRWLGWCSSKVYGMLSGSVGVVISKVSGHCRRYGSVLQT